MCEKDEIARSDVGCAIAQIGTNEKRGEAVCAHWRCKDEGKVEIDSGKRKMKETKRNRRSFTRKRDIPLGK